MNTLGFHLWSMTMFLIGAASACVYFGLAAPSVAAAADRQDGIHVSLVGNACVYTLWNDRGLAMAALPVSTVGGSCQ